MPFLARFVDVICLQSHQDLKVIISGNKASREIKVLKTIQYSWQVFLTNTQLLGFSRVFRNDFKISSGKLPLMQTVELYS
jgi:hypothetical protein